MLSLKSLNEDQHPSVRNCFTTSTPERELTYFNSHHKSNFMGVVHKERSKENMMDKYSIKTKYKNV